ncbi:MAG TPA: cytochrome c oxidase assembly protein, partial [Ktedonobacteraceae bacterium]
WPWHPWTMLVLLVLCVLYFLGSWQARKKTSGPVIKQRHIVAFISSIVLMALVLLTPIDTVARTQYFWVHIAQTITLTTVCAPLLIVSCSWVVALVLTRPVIRTILAFLTGPVVASILFNVVFLLWHAPRIMDSAVNSPALYEVMEWSIFFFSLLNWYPLIGESRELRTMSYPMQMLYAFIDGQPVDIFAFVLVYTDTPIYPHFQASMGAHLPAYADQALGGALLLIPGLVDLAVMTPLFFHWLKMIERRSTLADQRRQLALEAEEDEEEWEEEEREVQPGHALL